LPVPNMKMTSERPASSNTAVPTNSERNIRHGNCQLFWPFVMSRSARTDQELPSLISRRVRCVFQRTKSSTGGTQKRAQTQGPRPATDFRLLTGSLLGCWPRLWIRDSLSDLHFEHVV